MMSVRFLSLAALAAILLTGCYKKEVVETRPPRPVVSIVVPEPVAFETRRFSGLVESAEGAPLSFESGGRIVEVFAKEGQRYKQGEVLAQVDDSTYQNDVASAQASLTNAQQEVRRLRQSYSTGNASQSDLDAVIAQAASRKAEFENASKALRDTKLTMPYDGVIGSVSVERQQVVQVGEVVMKIQGKTGLEFEIGVPARDIGVVNTGLEAEIALGTFPGEVFPGVVSEIATEVSANGTYPVTLTMSGTAGEQSKVKVGMDGEVILKLPNPRGDVIQVPATCIAGTAGRGTYCWVLTTESPEADTGIVQKREVETGLLTEDGTIEILEGLEPGERIVSRGVHAIQDGMEVTLL
ncbi:MAG: efflux RND transporter periplasmic adaptor subunit [Verrucomicrobiota bacterium]